MLALDEYCTMMTDMVVTELRDSEGRAYDRLVRHIKSSTQTNVADTRRNGCLMAKSASELGVRDKPVSRRIKRMIDAYQAALVETIAAAQREGDIDKATDPKGLAALLLTVLRGMVALRTVGSPPSTIAAAGEQAIALLPRTSSHH